MHHWDINCPHCGRTLEMGIGAPGYVRIGHEMVQCPGRKCRMLVRSGAHEWAHMSGRQKWGYLFSYSVIALLPLGVLVAIWQDSGAGWVRYAVLLTLVPIFAVKALKITLSLRRAPYGSDQVTVRYADFPKSYLWFAFAVFALSIAGASYPEADWSYRLALSITGFIAALVAIYGMHKGTAMVIDRKSNEEMLRFMHAKAEAEVKKLRRSAGN